MKFKDYNHDLENIFEACGFDEKEFLEFNASALAAVMAGSVSISVWIEELDKLVGESDIYRRWAAMAVIFLSCAALLHKKGALNETVH